MQQKGTSIVVRMLTIFIIASSSLLVILATLAPIKQSLVGYPSGEREYSFLINICHQYPTRCIWLLNRPMALCARCTFGYIGVVIGCVTVLRNNVAHFSSGKLLLGLLIFLLMLIDPIIQLRTEYESTNYIRMITGMIGGYAITMFLFPFRLKRRMT